MADLHIVCPRCAATNRMPIGKYPGGGKCGSCHNALFDGAPASVDADGFEKHLRHNDIPVLVDVWAAWCGPCRVMAPMFAAAAARLEPNVRLIKLNADETPAIAAQYQVNSIPALLLFRGGHLITRAAGVMDAPRIVTWTQRHLAEAA